jgi:hypothetical protein
VLYLYFACPCYVSLAEQKLNIPPVFSGDPVTRSLVVCVMFCRSLFVLLSFFFWPLCCQFFFNLRILITSLLSYVSLDCPISTCTTPLATNSPLTDIYCRIPVSTSSLIHTFIYFEWATHLLCLMAGYCIIQFGILMSTNGAQLYSRLFRIIIIRT